MSFTISGTGSKDTKKARPFFQKDELNQLVLPPNVPARLTSDSSVSIYQYFRPISVPAVLIYSIGTCRFLSFHRLLRDVFLLCFCAPLTSRLLSVRSGGTVLLPFIAFFLSYVCAKHEPIIASLRFSVNTKNKFMLPARADGILPASCHAASVPLLPDLQACRQTALRSPAQ